MSTTPTIDFDARVDAYIAKHPGTPRSVAMQRCMTGVDVAEREAEKDPFHARAVAYAAKAQREGRPIAMSQAMNDVLLGRDVKPAKDAATIAHERAAAKKLEIEREAARLADEQFESRIAAWMTKNPKMRRSEAMGDVFFGRDIAKPAEAKR